MPFPFSLSGTFSAPLRHGESPEAFRTTAIAHLERIGARDVMWDSRRLTFDGSFRLFDRPMAFWIDGGQASLTSRDGAVVVSYTLSFRFIVWILLAVCLLVSAVSFLSGSLLPILFCIIGCALYYAAVTAMTKRAFRHSFIHRESPAESVRH